MSPKDLSAQPVLAHGKQSGDWRTGYIEHAEELTIITPPSVVVN